VGVDTCPAMRTTLHNTHRGHGFLARLAVMASALLAFLLISGGARAAVGVPQDNLIKNPSFSQGTRSWDGVQARLRRVRVSGAADHHFAVKVKALPVSYRSRPARREYGIRDRSAALRGTVAGRRYRASAWVRGTSGPRGTHGRRVILYVREISPSGKLVRTSQRSVRLPAGRFRKVSLYHRVAISGDTLRIQVSRSGAVLPAGDSFYADAIALTPPSRPLPTGPVPNTVSQIAIVTSQEEVMLAEQGSRYRYIVIRDQLARYIPELRAANPGTQVLVYKNAAFTGESDSDCEWAPYEVSGLNYCQVKDHEDWYLHDSAGNHVGATDYDDQIAMNIGSAGYREAWLASVRKRLEDVRNDGSGARYDGVFVDDVNMAPGHGMDGSFAELSDSAYRQAMVGFMQTIGPALKQEGFAVMANVGLDDFDNTQRQATLAVARSVSAVNREHFVRWAGLRDSKALFSSPAVQGNGDWLDELTLMEEVEQQGAGYNAMVYGRGDEVQTERYARATFLMGWNGRDGSALTYRADGPADAYSPDWTTSVGLPVSDRYPIGSGWRRDFSGGTVVIDPSPNQSQTFQLGGSYRMPSGECESSVSLPPLNALVLPAC
jgi:hypothetical protein